MDPDATSDQSVIDRGTFREHQRSATQKPGSTFDRDGLRHVVPYYHTFKANAKVTQNIITPLSSSTADLPQPPPQTFYPEILHYPHGTMTTVTTTTITDLSRQGRWFNRCILDVLHSEFHAVSKDYYANAIRDGRVLVRGHAGDAMYMVREGDWIEHKSHRHEDPVLAIPAQVIAETKEVGLLMHPTCISCASLSLTALFFRYEHSLSFALPTVSRWLPMST
jgi:hypothetical protein